MHVVTIALVFRITYYRTNPKYPPRIQLQVREEPRRQENLKKLEDERPTGGKTRKF